MRSVLMFMTLARPTTSCLIFASVFLPIAARSGDAYDSFRKALPTLFIAMCTFIVNDIDDVEADQVNHPHRPLPSGYVLLSSATVFYFISLAIALFSVKFFTMERISFFYYTLLLLGVNYQYAEEYLPNFKSFYVASVSTVPILIVINSLSGADQLYLVAASVFFFVLGREILLDFLDQAADKLSFIHSMSRAQLTICAFSCQVIGLSFLSTLVRNSVGVMVLLLISTLTPLSLLWWLKSPEPRKAAGLMKAQMYIGLYFLIL